MRLSEGVVKIINLVIPYKTHSFEKTKPNPKGLGFLFLSKRCIDYSEDQYDKNSR